MERRRDCGQSRHGRSRFLGAPFAVWKERREAIRLRSVLRTRLIVSGGVARKEHDEFSSNIDLIDVLPPGLYEAVFEAKDKDTAGRDLVTGEWVMRCEARTLDDIRNIVLATAHTSPVTVADVAEVSAAPV